MPVQDIGDAKVTFDENPRFWPLVRSDYHAAHLEKPRSIRTPKGLLQALLRYSMNPSLQLAFLVRMVQCGPEWLQWPVRWLQVVLFSSEIWWFRGTDERIQIGPGIHFPHPYNIIVGGGVHIGTNVVIHRDCFLGTDRGLAPISEEHVRCPVICDDVIVYAVTMIQGPYVVGEGARVGIRVMLLHDVPPYTHQTARSARPLPRPANA